MPNVEGLILAGNADFKFQLAENLEPRLKTKVIQVIDVSYGGENGLNEAITLASEALTNVKFVAEKKLVSKFFEQIALDTGMVVFGIDDTIKALELGALETIMLFEDIEAHRYLLKHPIKGDSKVLILNATQEKNQKFFKDAESGVSYDVVERDPLAEWLCNNYTKFGAKLEFITDKSQEGFQFVKGFGGIGGFLRYKIELENHVGVTGAGGGDDFDADNDFI